MALQSESTDFLTKAGQAVVGDVVALRDLGVSLIEDFNALIRELEFLRLQFPDPDPLSAGQPAGVKTALGVSTSELQIGSSDLIALARTITECFRRVCLELSETAVILNGTELLADSMFSGGDEGYLRRKGKNTYTLIASNLGATVDPTADDDAGRGYSVGSVWINTFDQRIFKAEEVVLSNAVWRRQSPPQTSFCLFSDKDSFEYPTPQPTGLIVEINTTTALTRSHGVVLVDASGGNVVCNLPASAAHAGRQYAVKKIDSSGNTVTLDASGAETIEGVTTKVLSAQYDSVTIVCDGTEWWIIGSV